VSEAVREAAREVERRLGGRTPRVALVLGSGLGPLADEVQSAVRIPYAEIPGFPPSRVAGHAGELVIGTLEGVPVLAQSGRFHLYEGHSPATAGLPVRVFATLGVGTLIVTNAAGGLRETFAAGSLMMITELFIVM
jgi:purine-nucleoside phosphorylase